MSDESYHKLVKVLDSLPNGFPATESGVEIRLLKKIFQPDEVELFCDLKLSFETAKKIAKRTGRPLEGLEEKLTSMQEKGQVFGVQLGDAKLLVHRVRAVCHRLPFKSGSTGDEERPRAASCG